MNKETRDVVKGKRVAIAIRVYKQHGLTDEYPYWEYRGALEQAGLSLPSKPTLYADLKAAKEALIKEYLSDVELTWEIRMPLKLEHTVSKMLRGLGCEVIKKPALTL